ncbi:hypothetical protein OHA72_52745 [Dactylosporangium sp. NBC_01737]|uniref:hypothetical protein n=1 Tax=Dactylosporangium sp. NBC_01737 TaxID=2975959 RepID=UPI002E13E300|nr:hypothetical protein OHA72_52745 [Dactylosporangium sp. NBC_01737]
MGRSGRDRGSKLAAWSTVATVALVLAALTAAAAWIFLDEHTDWQSRGEPVTAPAVATVRIERAAVLDGTVADLARSRAEKFVLNVAGVPQSTFGNCPDPPKDGWRRCVVDYDSLITEVDVYTGVYDLVGLNPGSPYDESMLRVRGRKLVYTRDGVLTALFRDFADHTGLRCERLEDRAVFVQDGPLPPICYGYPPGRNIIRIRFMVGSDDTVYARRY